MVWERLCRFFGVSERSRREALWGLVEVLVVRRGHHGLFPGSWTPTERRGSWEWWGGPLGGLEEGQDQTFDGKLSEDANSDKVRGVKVFVKIPKISKIRKIGEAKHVSFLSFYLCIIDNYKIYIYTGVLSFCHCLVDP